MPQVSPTRDEIRNRIVLRMLGRDVPLTDLTQAAVMRIMLEEMVVEEFLRLYAGLARDHRQWFINTATAGNLDRRLADFGLTREPPRAGTGFVRASNTDAESFSIAAGTVYRTNPDAAGTVRRFQVLPNPDNLPGGSWPSVSGADDLEYAIAKVQALTVGLAGNTPSSTIVALENTADAKQAVITNELPIVDGRDQEDDDALRERFRRFLDGLTRGTRASIRFGILGYVDADGNRPVKSVALVEWGGQTLLSSATSMPVALQVYIDDGTGSASSGLVAEIQALIDGDDTSNTGLRAAGIPTEVVSASPLPVTTVVHVTAGSGTSPAEVKRLVEEAVRAYIGQLPVAGQLVTGELQGQVIRAQLFRRVMNVGGVLEANITSPGGNIPVPIGRKALPSVVTVTVTVGSV